MREPEANLSSQIPPDESSIHSHCHPSPSMPYSMGTTHCEDKLFQEPNACSKYCKYPVTNVMLDRWSQPAKKVTSSPMEMTRKHTNVMGFVIPHPPCSSSYTLPARSFDRWYQPCRQPVCLGRVLLSSPLAVSEEHMSMLMPRLEPSSHLLNASRARN